MRKPTLTAAIVGAVTLAIMFTVGAYEWRFEQKHGRHPLTGCLARNLKAGPSYGRETLAKFSIAKVKLGTDADFASERLRAAKLDGTFSRPFAKRFTNALPIAFGPVSQAAILEGADLAALGRQVTSQTEQAHLRYNVVSTSYRSDNIVTGISISGIRNEDQDLEVLLRDRLGNPTYSFSTWGDCSDTQWLVYGNDNKLNTPNFMTAEICDEVKIKTFYVRCDKDRISRSVWLAVRLTSKSFSIVLKDGEAQYRNKYVRNVRGGHLIPVLIGSPTIT